MRRLIGLGALLTMGGLSVAVARGKGQAPQAPLPDLVKVKDNLYMIGSSSPADRASFTGGNTGIFITTNGVALTAAHCMPNPETLGEKTLCAGLWDGSHIRAHRVLASAQFGNLDIAVVKIENVKSKCFAAVFRICAYGGRRLHSWITIALALEPRN